MYIHDAFTEDHDYFSNFFRPTNPKKFFQYFFRNLRLKIHKLAKFHEKEN